MSHFTSHNQSLSGLIYSGYDWNNKVEGIESYNTNTYEVPSNGVIRLSSQTGLIGVVDVTISGASSLAQADVNVILLVPVFKGQRIRVSGSANGKAVFIPYKLSVK